MNGVLTKTLRAIICGSSLLATSIAAQAGQLDEAASFDIPAQSIENALLEFSRQTGLQIVFTASALPHLDAPQISGTMPLKQALDLLLRGTELGYKLVGERTLTVIGARMLPASDMQQIHLEEGIGRADHPTGGAEHGMLAQSKSPKRIRLAQAGQAIAGSSAAKDDSAYLDEVVVTAQRRRQNLQDVPIAVSVLSGETIRELGFSNLRDLRFITPGLMVSSITNISTPLWKVRGVGTNLELPTQAASVGVYINDVPTPQIGQGFYMFDVEQAEVLRGPQGTLFGANTSGGTIVVKTRKPGDTFGGDLAVSVGNYGALRLEGGVDLPFREDLAMRLAFLSDENDGFVRNTYLGNRANMTDVQATRVTVLYQPNDVFTANLEIHQGDARGDAGTYRVIGTRDPLTQLPCDISRILRRECVDVHGFSSADYGFWDAAQDVAPVGDVSSEGGSLVLTWDTPIGVVTSASGLEEATRDFQEDVDGSPASFRVAHYRNDERQFTQELRLAGSGGRLEWVLGGFYLEDKVKQLVLSARPGVPGSFSGTGTEPEASARVTDAVHENLSAFGDVTFALTDRWDVSAGLRYTDTTRDVDYFSSIVSISPSQWRPDRTPGYGYPRSHVVVPGADGVVKVDSSAVSGRAIAKYRANDRVMVYGSYARGFREATYDGAAFTLGNVAIVDPEYNDSFELGAKIDLLDRWLRANVSAFSMKLTDQQIYTLIDSVPRFSNAGSMTSRGVEVELNIAPDAAFSSYLSVSYLDARFDEFIAPNGDDFAGNMPEDAPEWKVTALGRYERPLTRGFTLGVQADLSWRSEYFLDVSNHPVSRQDALLLLNGSVGISFPNETLRLELWGRNLTNEEEITSFFNGSGIGLLGHAVGAPRTYGIRALVEF